MRLDPTRRAEIATWAAAWVCENEAMLRGLSEQDPRWEGEALWYQLHARGGICDDAALGAAIEAARTDPAIFDALAAVGSDRLRCRESASGMPTLLRHFLADVLAGRRTRPRARPGPSRPDRYRDLWIFVFVLDLVQRFDLRPGRNDEGKHDESACDFAAAALGAAGLRPRSYGRVKAASESQTARLGRGLAAASSAGA